jgi:hypothetical protein
MYVCVYVRTYQIYSKENMYSMFKDKLQNCTPFQYEKIQYMHNDTIETEMNINIYIYIFICMYVCVYTYIYIYIYIYKHIPDCTQTVLVLLLLPNKTGVKYF